MKKYLLLIVFLMGISVAASAFEKNVLNVEYRAVPDNFETLIKTEADKWNFNFMPYSDDAEMLWSDPAFRRDVSTTGGSVKRVTAVYGACNELGLTILVYSAEPELQKTLAEGKAMPRSTLEMFFAPGDADNDRMQHWYQFIFSQHCSADPVMDYPWLEHDRNFRRITGEVKVVTKILDNAYITRVFIPWSLLDNRTPFSDKADNFWRIGIYRWCPGLSQTWGGRVQAMTSTGYFRMPAFTPEQKDAIRKNLLLRAWGDYTEAFQPVHSAEGNREAWRKVKEVPAVRSYAHISEEREFMAKALPPVVERCNAICAEIAKYDTLSEAEKESLLKRAKVLMQFTLDYQTAHAEMLKNKFFAPEAK